MGTSFSLLNSSNSKLNSGPPPKLIAKTISGYDISDKAAREVFDLFVTFFLNEYQSFEEFKAYLKEAPQDLLLFTDQKGELVGFIILKRSSYNLEGHRFRVVEGVRSSPFFII